MYRAILESISRQTFLSTLGLYFCIVQICCLAKFYLHIRDRKVRIDDLQARTITHEDGVHLEVDADLNLKHTTAVLGILTLEFLRRMKRLGLDILALFGIRPKLDAARSVVQILAHSYHIVEDTLGVEIGIFVIGSIVWLNACYAIKRQVIESMIRYLASEKKPTVAELFQNIWTENVFGRFCSVERLIHDPDSLLMYYTEVSQVKIQ